MSIITLFGQFRGYVCLLTPLNDTGVDFAKSHCTLLETMVVALVLLSDPDLLDCISLIGFGDCYQLIAQYSREWLQNM